MGKLEELATKKQTETDIAGITSGLMNIIGSEASSVVP